MKNKLKYRFSNFKYMINSEKFKLTFILILMVDLYGIFGLAFNRTYYDGFFVTLTNKYFCMLILAILLLNTVNTYSLFENNANYILRLKSKKNYLIELLKSVVFNNTILFIIIIIILTSGLNLFNTFSSSSTFLNYYSVNVLVYLVFYIFRMFILMQIISIINALLLKLFDLKILVCLNIVFYASLIGYMYGFGGEISSINKTMFYIGNYFSLYKYADFTLEVLCSIIYILLLVFISYILFIFINKNIKQIGD